MVAKDDGACAQQAGRRGNKLSHRALDGLSVNVCAGSGGKYRDVGVELAQDAGPAAGAVLVEDAALWRLYEVHEGAPVADAASTGTHVLEDRASFPAAAGDKGADALD